MTVRLTKRRLRELDTTLSLDEVLYEKFRRLREQLHHEEARFAKAQRIVSVVQQRGKLRYHLPVLGIQHTPYGINVVVGGA